MFWRVLIGVLTIAAIVSLVSLWGGSGPVGSENLVDRALPPFAAPLAAGAGEGDAHVYTREQARALDSVAACDVRMSGVFNSCRDLRGSAILNFWSTTKPACMKQVDVLDEFASRHEDVTVAAVAFDQPERTVRSATSGRGWKLDVPIDRDGAVAALYAVAGCPTTFFIVDGTISAVKLGTLDAQLIGQQLKQGERAGGRQDG